VYGAFASIFGSLLGFVIAAVAIALPFASDTRLAVVRLSNQNKTLWELFLAGTRALAGATLLSMIALVLDRDDNPHRWILIAVAFFTILACIRVARVVWALQHLVGLMIRPPPTA
jgi:uncharacterized membrane protein YqjE